MSILLSAKDVTKTYKTASGEVHALNGVSYDFEQGVFYAIIGRSGSGKSTFLHILGGLDQPTSGQLLLHYRVFRHVESLDFFRIVQDKDWLLELICQVGFFW